MGSAPPDLEYSNPGARKRKWSPMKEDSEDGSITGRSTIEAREDSATPGTILGSDTETPHKRSKLQNAGNPVVAEAIPGQLAKEVPRVPQLSMDVWQHICSFLEPVSLGRLIRVNRALNGLLDSQKRVPGDLKKKNLTQNDIWSTSRKRLLPWFPRPLSWMSELDTWRLLLGISCQFCGKKPKDPGSSARSPWASGPGQDGVRIIWPFGVRSCGKCLATRMTKDADLRFTDNSILLSGLPYAYFTSDLNFATATTLRASSPPVGLDLTRYYSQPHVDKLRQEMDHVSSLGQAAAEEWVKGLDDVGRQEMEIVRRLEHWEATGGLQALLRSRAKIVVPPRHGLPPKPNLPVLSLSSVPEHIQVQANSAGSRSQSPLSASYKQNPAVLSHLSGFNTLHLPLKPASPAPGQQLPTLPPHSSSVNHSQGPRGRPERNVGDVNQRKAERRAEIERRCLQLKPPIKSSTLPYMEAFHNAMQISMALNDNAWEVLKPRLTAQHDAALRKEEDFLAKNKNFQPQVEHKREHEEQLRHAQNILDCQRDEAQRPVREKLAAYADELIKSDWNDGAGVVKHNAPQFAADLLTHVRRRFFEALDDNDKRFEVRGASTTSTSPIPGAHNDRHLTLEDMKWVYETKIKPITQYYSKEIFLCGACDIDRKHYALDAVIQHYAAKHTHTFSHGSAIVYWKADWPPEPPFDPRPLCSPKNQLIDHNGVSPKYQRDTGRPQNVDPIFALPEQIYPARPGVAMTPDRIPRPLARYVPAVFPVDEEAYRIRSRLVPVQAGIARPAIYGSGAGYERHRPPMTPVSPAVSARDLAAGHYRVRNAEAYQQPYPVHRYDPSMMSPVGTNGYGAQRPQVLPTKSRLEHRPLPQPGQAPGFHQVQIAEVASDAREIWNGTDGIDRLPGSVRIHVIIHHIVLRFHEKYTNELTLALFTDALLTTSHMEPLHNLQDLTCKACMFQSKDINDSDHRILQYKLPDLLKHFQTCHMDMVALPTAAHTRLEIPTPDWKVDMVQLPDERTIRSLIHCPGMTDSKLNLIATIMWRYFPSPLPQLDHAAQSFPSRATKLLTDEPNRPLPQPIFSTVEKEGTRDFMPLDGQPIEPEQPPARTSHDYREAVSTIEEKPCEDGYDPQRPTAPRPGPVLDYEIEYPRLNYPEPLRSRYAYDDRYTPQPPYRLSGSNHQSSYGDDTLGAPRYPNLMPRRQYVEDEYIRQTRYVPTTIQYLSRSVPYEDMGFYDDRGRGRALSPVQQVKLEAADSPIRDSASGAVEFLNNFDLNNDPAERYGSPDKGSLPDRASNNASSNRISRNPAGPRNAHDRNDSQDRPESGITSRKETPHKAVSRRGASVRSKSPPLLAREDPQHPQQKQPYLGHLANAAVDREPVQHRQSSNPRYLERHVYEDELMPQHYIPVNSYRTRSPGYGQQKLPLGYAEARAPPHYGYLDHEPYEQRGGEYVQVMPHNGPQYIEHRIPPENLPEYVGTDGGYGRAVGNHREQTYYGAPQPRREIRYDSYDDRRRY